MATTEPPTPIGLDATRAAISAASGMDCHPKTHALQTPVSASYPSELVRSSIPGTPAYIKREDSIKTPITPPSAYMDYLKNFPGLISPPTTSGSTSKFPSAEQSFMRSSASESEERSDISVASQKSASSPQTREPSAPQPPLSRQVSSESTSSFSTVSSTLSSASTESIPATVQAGSRAKPESPRIIIPPSQFARPGSARIPRHLTIPQSPFSAASARSPISARSLQSPYSTSALSQTPWSASFTGRTAFSPRHTEEEAKSRNGKVCVRQIVTRTVTYCRTPLDPAPKGKRRKIESAEEGHEETKLEPEE